MNGTIFNIQRFCTSDGFGIRTVAFLKGCPLHCSWCHNPESQNPKSELMYNFEKCIGCRACENCKTSAHKFNDTHQFFREKCIVCGECATVCPSGALEFCGEITTSDDLVQKLTRDKAFFDESNGGITLSGGEPLMQFDFSLDILKKAKQKGIQTAVETCGYTNCDITKIAPFADVWLFDIKLLDDLKHQKFTGVSNELILKNLHTLDDLGAFIILRCPIIPDVNFNKEHLDGIFSLAKSLKNVKKVQFLPYHPLGINKAKALGKTQNYNNEDFLEPKSLQEMLNSVKSENIEFEIM